MFRRYRSAAWLVALLSLSAVSTAVWYLEQARSGIAITHDRVDGTPVTVFRPAGSVPEAPLPPVLIAHGFAGSQQLMQAFALTLARNGFTAITFDFPGHGRNPVPMRGGLADQDESLRILMATLASMGAYARRFAEPDGRYAVIGHSMASDMVVRQGQSDSTVQAVVGVSMFAPTITAESPADSPRNLLVLSGALEPAAMATEALRLLGSAGGSPAAFETTYGRFDHGTARRATLVPGVEHISVLYSGRTLSETLDWLSAAFDKDSQAAPFIDTRGPALGLLLLGLVGLAWPLSMLLPSRSAPLVGNDTPPAVEKRLAGGPAAASAKAPAVAHGRARWWGVRGYALAAIAPALITPLALRMLPTDFLPILLGDYLALHFGLYGLLTLGAMGLTKRSRPLSDHQDTRAFFVATLAVVFYALFVLGLPLDRYVFNVRPEAVRLPSMAVIFAGTLMYFLADEWFSRTANAAPLTYVVTKLCFLLSLVLAIALDPPKLFFLALIVPAILILFTVYGLVSRWVFRATRRPFVAAIANAAAFAWFIAVTFPLVR